MTKRVKSILMVIVYILIYVVVQSAVALAVPVLTLVRNLIQNTKDIETLVSEFIVNANLASKNLSFIIIMSAVLSMLIYITIIHMRGKRIGDFIKTKKVNGFYVLVALVLTIALNCISVFITSLGFFKDLMPEYQDTVNRILSGNLWITLLAVGIIAPAFEEMMYRGFILKELRFAFGFTFANIFQALMFGVMHGNLVQGTYAAIIGYVLGHAYKKTESIYFVILVHILFNVGNVLMASMEVYLNMPFILTAGVLGCFLSLYVLEQTYHYNGR